ncbi:MAG: hypothetical protein AB7F28_08385 [Candidatus Margulisiibacteriota bacterium]
MKKQLAAPPFGLSQQQATTLANRLIKRNKDQVENFLKEAGKLVAAPADLSPFIVAWKNLGRASLEAAVAKLDAATIQKVYEAVCTHYKVQLLDLAPGSPVCVNDLILLKIAVDREWQPYPTSHALPPHGQLQRVSFQNKTEGECRLYAFKPKNPDLPTLLLPVEFPKPSEHNDEAHQAFLTEPLSRLLSQWPARTQAQPSAAPTHTQANAPDNPARVDAPTFWDRLQTRVDLRNPNWEDIFNDLLSLPADLPDSNFAPILEKAAAAKTAQILDYPELAERYARLNPVGFRDWVMSALAARSNKSVAFLMRVITRFIEKFSTPEPFNDLAHTLFSLDKAQIGHQVMRLRLGHTCTTEQTCQRWLDDLFELKSCAVATTVIPPLLYTTPPMMDLQPNHPHWPVYFELRLTLMGPTVDLQGFHDALHLDQHQAVFPVLLDRPLLARKWLDHWNTCLQSPTLPATLDTLKLMLPVTVIAASSPDYTNLAMRCVAQMNLCFSSNFEGEVLKQVGVGYALQGYTHVVLRLLLSHAEPEQFNFVDFSAFIHSLDDLLLYVTQYRGERLFLTDHAWLADVVAKIIFTEPQPMSIPAQPPSRPVTPILSWGETMHYPDIAKRVKPLRNPDQAAEFVGIASELRSGVDFRQLSHFLYLAIADSPQGLRDEAIRRLTPILTGLTHRWSGVPLPMVVRNGTTPHCVLSPFPADSEHSLLIRQAMTTSERRPVHDTRKILVRDCYGTSPERLQQAARRSSTLGPEILRPLQVGTELQKFCAIPSHKTADWMLQLLNIQCAFFYEQEYGIFCETAGFPIILDQFLTELHARLAQGVDFTPLLAGFNQAQHVHTQKLRRHLPDGPKQIIQHCGLDPARFPSHIEFGDLMSELAYDIFSLKCMATTAPHPMNESTAFQRRLVMAFDIFHTHAYDSLSKHLNFFHTIFVTTDDAPRYRRFLACLGNIEYHLDPATTTSNFRPEGRTAILTALDANIIKTRQLLHRLLSNLQTTLGTDLKDFSGIDPDDLAAALAWL